MVVDLTKVLAFVESTYFSQSIPDVLHRSAEFFMRTFRLSNCQIELYDVHHRAITNGSLSPLYRHVEDRIQPILNNRKTSYFVHMNSPDKVADSLRRLDACVAAFPVIAGGSMIGSVFLYSSYPLQDVQETMNALLSRLTKVAMHIKGYSEVKHSAMSDAMTGLYNKAYFEDAAERELVAANKAEEPTSMVIIDLDDFKKYNDTKGHVAGDNLLKSLAKVIKDCAEPTFVCARFGGEEFVMLLPRIGSPRACDWAEKLRQAIAQDCDVTASIGVSTCMKSKSSYSSMLKRSDEAMYKSKKTGKNCVTHILILDPSLSPVETSIAQQSQ